jgi:hypothetical protein
MPWWAPADRAEPWPVSKYMTLLPTVPRLSARAASQASRRMERVTPNERLVASVPPTDWNTRSTGTPLSISCSEVVTWPSTQPWVGISKRWMMSSSSLSRSAIAAGESEAGLMPITASPHPYIRPSTMDAVMPAGSSVGWFGCSRTAMVPGKPMVLRKRVTTRHFLAARIKSWLRMILHTAAAISGVMAGARPASASLSAVSDRMSSRSSPTVIATMAANARASWLSRMRRVTSSSS